MSGSGAQITTAEPPAGQDQVAPPRILSTAEIQQVGA